MVYKEVKMKKIKVCAYARFSSNNQRAESITTQLDTIKKYCDLKNMEIVKVFTDEAKTATSDEREGFIQMIEESKLKKWEGIVLYSLDRFSRNVANHYYYKSILDDYGIKLYAVIDGLDGKENAEIDLMTNIKVGLAEYYSAHLSRLILDACIMNSKNGLKCGGLDNFGFDTEKSVYKINEAEAKVVRIMFEMASKYNTITDIVKFLNSEGYVNKQGNPFNRSSVSYILRNKKYAGYMVYNQYKNKPKLTAKIGKRVLKPINEHIIIEDALPKIVDIELFNKVQDILDDYSSYQYKYGNRGNYLLAGLIRCSSCGYRFYHRRKHIGKGKQIRDLYTCANYGRKKTNTSSCKVKALNSSYLNNYILKLLDNVFLKETSVDEIKKFIVKKIHEYKIDLEGWIKNAINDYEIAKREIDRLSNIARQSTGTAKDSLMRAIELNLTESLQKQNDIKVKNEELNSIKEPDFVDIKKLIDKYKVARIAEDYISLREIILLMIESIIVSNEKVTILINYNKLVKNYSKDLISVNEEERDYIAYNRFVRVRNKKSG